MNIIINPCLSNFALQLYNLIFTPTFLATLLLKYVKSKSVNVVVESKNKDDEKIIFLSNSVILAFE